MSRCLIGKKKIQWLRRETGLPVIAALVRGDTDHRIDLCLDDGRVVYFFKDGTMAETLIRHRYKQEEATA
jgi:hypothetical protein